VTELKDDSRTAAIIAEAVVAPGHDGEAVLVVRVRHENGALDTLTLSGEQTQRVLDACGATSPDELKGTPRGRLLEALAS
jgi:hypothetical protein